MIRLRSLIRATLLFGLTSYCVVTKAAAPAATATAPAAAKAATTVEVPSSAGKVEFHAVGRPSMIKINGEGKGPQGSLNLAGNKVTGDLKFDMTSLNSGISMRDTHMKEKYLEVQKYPEAKLHLTEVTLPANWSSAQPIAKDANFRGDLTLHGQTHPVEGKFELTGEADAINAKANFEVKIDQFGIEIPKYLGITVKNEVEVGLSMNGLKPDVTK